MKKYTEKYLKHIEVNYNVSEHELLCEVCSKKAVDIHHIKGKGKHPELIENLDNLIALCRNCHEEYGQKKQYINFLYEKKKYR